MNKRILLLVSGSGGGHIEAGKNITRALLALAPEVECVTKDSYDFLHPFKRWQYTTGWEILFRYLGPVYGFARGLTIAMPWAIRRIRRGFEPSAHHLASWLATQEPFDAVVATQPHGAGLMAIAKRDSRWKNIYLAQTWTDFQYYEMYHWPKVDRYLAPAEDFALAARTAHSSDRVTVTGVPINPCFAVRFDRTATLTRFNLPDDGRPIVFVARGSMGHGTLITLRVVDALARARLPITIVANAGRNDRLLAQIRETLRRADPHTEPHVLGWIDNMHALLSVTDIELAKPGGLAVSEALARGIPLLAFRPIAGQEDANVAFIKRHHVGQLIKTPEQAVAAVRRLIQFPAELKAAKERARSLGFPDAAYRAARQVLEDIGVTPQPIDPQKSGKGC